MADAKVALDGIRDAVISKFKVLNFHITTLKSAYYFKNKTYYFLITLIYFRQNITLFTNKRSLIAYHCRPRSFDK